MIITGNTIKKLGIVTPFSELVDDRSLPSYGKAGCGYTLRMETMLHAYYLNPHDYVLFQTYEYITMPLDHCGFLYLKSTYTAQGLLLITDSVVDCGFNGRLRCRAHNTGDDMIKIMCQGGIIMLIVHQLNEEGDQYNGRYQEVL